MKRRSFRTNVLWLLAAFAISRILAKLSGVSFDYLPLFTYWQYLDVQSLQHNLLQSLWYQHSQPPVFNFLLGMVLKLSGSEAPRVFESLLMIISFVNACLLLSILEKIAPGKFLPLIFSLIYLLSPATILFENELFYTSFTSLLLLLVVRFTMQFSKSSSSAAAAGIFLSLTFVCLTRSTYHLALLLIVCSILLFSCFRKKGFGLIVTGSLVSIALVAGWYSKNYVLFNSFSSSSWLGINFARIVFHDVNVKDSSSIEAVHPGLPISFYSNYINNDYPNKYKGLNDRVLLQEMKNDSSINMNHVGYLQVSRKYMEAAERYVVERPDTYLAHVFASAIIFFTPASSYFKLQENNRKMRYYDLMYSLNLSHLSSAKTNKRLLLAFSAILYFSLYISVMWVLIAEAYRRRRFSTLNGTIIGIIIFVFLVSTFLEYGENMRFRYELQPLFLILASQAVMLVYKRNQQKRQFQIKPR